MKKRGYHFISLAIIALAFIFFAANSSAEPDIPECSSIEIVASYPAPEEFPEPVAPYSTHVHGIAYDGQSLWASCYGCGKIFELGFDDLGDLVVLDSVDAPSTNPTGITFVGRTLFAGDDGTKEISKIKTTGKKAGEIQDWFYAPGYPYEDCVGLTFARGHLWNADFIFSEENISAIHKIKMNGELDKSFYFPGWDCPEGLAFDGQYIWVGELCEARIYKLRVKDLEPVCYFDTGKYGIGPIGLTFDGEHLWIADAANQAFHKVDIGMDK